MLRQVVLATQRAESVTPERPKGSAWRWSSGLATLQREFPTIKVEIVDQPLLTAPVVQVLAWRSLAFDPFLYDSMLFRSDSAAPWRVQVVGPKDGETPATAIEVLTRYQSLINRRNAHSQTALFDRVVARHKELHDLSKPLVAADYLHALDTWQWVLRLWPVASAELQVAALFHDVERLVSEADNRAEQHSPDYLTFNQRHTRQGAEMAATMLRDVGFREDEIAQVQHLIEAHERPEEEAELALLNEADALSFFSLNSAGYLDYFGGEQTTNKIEYSLRRLRRSALLRLKGVRFRADVERLVVEQLRRMHAPALARQSPHESAS